MPFSISKKYKNTDWIKLNLTNETSPNWEIGIEIIKDRFNSRFLEQLNKLDSDRNSGFVIMAIDCLLIETLMQFYLGIESTESIYKGEHWKSFRDFFKNSSQFQTEFKTNKICKLFYQHFRCGLLHQAQTKLPSLIKTHRNSILTTITTPQGIMGLIIDRKIFHTQMKIEYVRYFEDLCGDKNNFKGEKLRVCAIRKMDVICTE